MYLTTWKTGVVRNIAVKSLLLGVFMIVFRFAYVITSSGQYGLSSIVSAGANRALESSPRSGLSSPGLYSSKDWIESVRFYTSVFHGLLKEGYLSPSSKALCVETPNGQDVFALKEIGVSDSVGVFKKAFKPLVVKSVNRLLPFGDNVFNFVFSGNGRFDRVLRPLDLVSEIARTLKPEGFVVVHVRAKDAYSFNSLLDLFNCCRLVKSRDLDNYDPLVPFIREIVLQKQDVGYGNSRGASGDKCSVPGHKLELVEKAEPLIEEEPLKPWITLKRNIKNAKYLPSMADISFKNRYVYLDVGARSYGSSIGSWFRKQYPKQNRTFDVYAIEADKTFHQEYKAKKRVRLLPYAAWVRNETLTFEIHRDNGEEDTVRGRGMGRIQQGGGSSGFDGEVEEIEGFDFADWLRRTVTNKDFVVMKMDVEGTEFDLIPRLFETGAICLVDEVFLECHYNRWQRCCPGQRSRKYEKTYGQCLELFTSLRQSGVLVHQWW